MNASKAHPVYEAAMALKRAGYRPWPLQLGTSVPAQGVGVDHRTHGGRSHVPLTEDEIASIWRKDRNVPGLGVVLGPGQYVLDLDPKNDPAVVSMFDELREMTRCDETPHGGLHAHFTEPGSARVPWARISAKGIDLLAEGSFVALPPDRGRVWSGQDKIAPKTRVEAFARDFVGRHGYGFEANSSNWRSDDGEDRVIPDHARNNTVTSLAGVLRKMGLAPNLLRAAIVGLATEPYAIETPLTDGEIDNIVASMSRRDSEGFELDGITRETMTPADSVPRLQWAIHHIIPDEALTVIHGLPAAGKSWVAMSICVACATGTPWPGNEAKATKLRVAYLDWERRGRMVRRRLIAYCRNRFECEIDYFPMKGALKSRMDWIRQQVALRGYGLVLIDSLTISMMGAEVNNSGEVIPTMFELQDICDDFKIAIVALDHQRKPQANDQGNASAFGSVFKEAIATMQWQALKTNTEFTDGYMDLKLRLHKKNHEANIPDISMRLVFEFDSEGDIENAYLKPRHEETLRDKVLMALDGELCRLTELQAKTGADDSTLNRLLTDLIRDGLVYIAEQGSRGRGKATVYGLAADREGNTD